MSVALPPSFQVALDHMRDELTARPDVVGVLFFGSASRGETRPGSDVDLYAITAQDSRGHLGRSIAGVPVEVSFGSVAQMTTQVRQERATVVHAFATGELLLDRTNGALPALPALRDEARALWARGPSPMSPDAVLSFRFHLTDMVRDLGAMPDRSPATALAASECIRVAIDAFCGAEQLWRPPPRTALTVLEPHHPEMTALVRQCAEAGFTRAWAMQVADLVLAHLGGRLDKYDTSCP